MSHTELVGVPIETREVHPDGLDPWRRSAGQSLLMHLLTIDSIGKAVQHAGPVVEGIDDAVGDGEVIPSKIKLGLPTRGEVNPVGIADLDDPISDL
jgi:hypothetical protein